MAWLRFLASPCMKGLASIFCSCFSTDDPEVEIKMTEAPRCAPQAPLPATMPSTSPNHSDHYETSSNESGSMVNVHLDRYDAYSYDGDSMVNFHYDPHDAHSNEGGSMVNLGSSPIANGALSRNLTSSTHTGPRRSLSACQSTYLDVPTRDVTSQSTRNLIPYSTNPDPAQESNE